MRSTSLSFFPGKLQVALAATFALLGVGNADQITLQFFLGGFEDVPEGSVGALVVDSNGDGFDSVYLAAVDSTQLEVGQSIAGSDDVIVAVTEAISSGFANGKTGFMGTFPGIDYSAYGLEEGDGIQFFWFADSPSGLSVIPANVSFDAYENGNPDAGGDIGYTLPPAPGVYTLSHLEADQGGAIPPISPETGMVGPIVSQPVGGSFEGGAEVTIAVGTQGSQSFTYEWFEGEVGDESIPVTGATGSSFVLSAVNYSSSYWVKVTDSSGSVNSMAAVVDVSGGGLRPELTWERVDGVDWYNVYIRKDGAVLANLWIEGYESNSWQSESNLGAGNYDWWVRGWSSASGYTSWIAQPSFSIAVPELLTPVGPQSDGEWRPEFTWTRSLGSQYYRLQIQRNGATWQNIWIEGFENNVWAPTEDLPMGEYTVWVAPWSSAHGLGPYSEPISFSIGMPVPVAPSGDVDRGDVSTLELTWDASSKNDWIQVYLRRNGSFWASNWFEVSEGTSWAFNDPVLPSGSYDWWIRGYNPEDSRSSWVAGPDFTIDGIEVLSPVDDSVITGIPRPLFSWELDPGAEWYQIYLAKGSTVVFYNWIEAASSWTPDVDLTPGEHAFYIRSYRPDTSVGAWVGPVNFSVD